MFFCNPPVPPTLTNRKQDATLAHYAGYTEEEIEPVFLLMVDYLYRPVSHEAFFKKYASKKFLKGKHLEYYLCSLFNILINHSASILTRQWAKKYHHLYVDGSDQGTYAKDEQ